MFKSRGIEKLHRLLDVNNEKVNDVSYIRIANELKNRDFVCTERASNQKKHNSYLNEILVATDCGVKRIYVRKTRQKIGNGCKIVSIPVTKHYDFVVIDDSENFWILPDLFIHNRQAKSNYISVGKKHEFYKNNFELLNMKSDEMLQQMVYI